MELIHLKNVHLGLYLAVNKLITEKMQNIFSLIAKYSDFIKYTLNKLNKSLKFPFFSIYTEGNIDKDNMEGK